YLLKLLSLSGFHPALTACAVCGMQTPELFSAGQGGAVCVGCAEHGAGPVSAASLAMLAHLASSQIEHAGDVVLNGDARREARGLPRTEGHAAGEEALFDTVEGGLDIGLKWLTVYAFSTENWRRPPDEVRYLMNFNRGLLRRRRDELHERGARIQFLGRVDW